MASVSGAHSSRTLLDIIPHYSKSKSAVDVGSVRLKSLVGVTPLMSNTSRFPKLEECAHFHYEHVDLLPIVLEVVGEESAKNVCGATLRVTSGSENWLIRRTYDHFCKLDEQLHQCVFDRKFSELPVISTSANKTEKENHDILDEYIRRLSSIWSGCAISCGPVLSWFELDNRGRRIVASGHGINTPAVAAAFATTPYTANATDELSFQIGDMISVIDMPPAEESSWWRGKRGFVVGFFPSNCVAVITDKIPTEITLAEPSKPVLRKHGKLIAFFRAFILSRPSRRRLKQTGILKERVFGCDLSEHLLNTGREIPLVLKCCAEFIEAHGIVDGIYRLSGVTSNIQRLRSIFDEDRVPVLEEDSGLKQDVHGVASLLKMYFRELPNPLCTYQLYDEFVAAVQSPNDLRLDNMRKVVQKLPPPHYRTLEYLMGHLGRVCGHSTGTGMTARNVAIVWAPNLLRCRSLDQGVAALQGVGVQAVVTEFLILYAPLIFSSQDGDKIHLRPKSLAVSSPTKLLTLEEAMARGQHSPASCTGELPPDMKAVSCHPSFHTVIDLPRKRQILNWRTIFTPRRNLQPKSPRHFKRKTIIKSAEFLSSTLTGERPGIHQASGPSTANHSRSVSHDSYFDNIEHKSTSSLVETQHEGLSLSLDLSELQMNFELEDSDMRIFSEDETNQLFSSGASIAFGVLEDDMNLEKRFSTQNLRYIDSYSPDPMEGETPSDGLQTPGYQPLLVSTPGSYENVRVSSCFDSASSRKSDVSPFTYEKLVDSPNNADVQKRENDLYEPCTPTGGSASNVYEIMDLEQEIYEPIAAGPMTVKMEERNHYENDSVVHNLEVDESHNNIYEDIRCASTADIYEKVSNFRNSVNEVNTLAHESLSQVETCKTPSVDEMDSVKTTCEDVKLTPTDSPSKEKTESMASSPSKMSGLERHEGTFTAVENEHQFVPDFKSPSEDLDETSKTYYQNINLSPDVSLRLEEKYEEESPMNSESVDAICASDEPNLNVNILCDSNLSASNSSNNVSEVNVSISCEGLENVTADAEVGASSRHPTCSVVGEVLKRDCQDRTKGVDAKDLDDPRPCEPAELDKTEPMIKLVDVKHRTPGEGAQSKMTISREDLNLPLDSSELDLERRERIERYKEERRNFFRNKYKTDSLNNNEERENELIRRIKQKTKKELRTMDLSPSDEDFDFNKRSPSKTTVNISYSPTKGKTFDLESVSLDEIAPTDASTEEDRPS